MSRSAPRRVPLAIRLLAIPVTVVVVLVGIWVTGGLVTNDFELAMWLSAGWMALAGAIALAIAFRSRVFRWPVLAAYVVTATVVGVYLSASVFMDDVVDERVATVAPATAGDPAAMAGGGTPGRRTNMLLRSGRFEPVRHAARGDAKTIELAEGGRVLTLTNFEVDNGPDLRLYLVAGPATTEARVADFVDLGALKGNVGNQQYSLPADLDLERYTTAVVWCRAFSVLFARAPLRT